MKEVVGMLFEISAADSRPIFRQIMDEVQRGIAAGLLRPDEPLPAARQLAAELRVNPNTVSHAYRELERLGFVYVRRGRGTFVSPGGAVRTKPVHLARQVAERALRDAFRHGLLASDLVAAIKEIAPRRE
jgi:GntR family transcriptional regulator